MTSRNDSKPLPDSSQVSASKESAIKWQIYTAADPTVERIIPALAKEIGLNESIVLMQISFWIGQSKNVRNGTYWTYHSLREMQRDFFPYWGIETVRRTIKSLERKGLIIVKNYNKRKGDNTQWFSLVPDTLSSLTSVLIAPAIEGRGVSERDTETQNETPRHQNETTLPETFSETTHDIGSAAPSKSPTGKSYPVDLTKWSRAHIDAYYGEHKSGLDALTRANEEMQDVKHMGKYDALDVIERYQDCIALNIPVESYPAVVAFTKGRARQEKKTWTWRSMGWYIGQYKIIPLNSQASDDPAPDTRALNAALFREGAG